MKTFTKYDINFKNKKINSINGITFRNKNFILSKNNYINEKTISDYNHIEIHQTKLSSKFKKNNL